jgi:hypothetical protein
MPVQLYLRHQKQTGIHHCIGYLKRAIIPNQVSVEEATHARPNNLFSGRSFERAFPSYHRIGTNVSAYEGDCAGKDAA